ncbi:MAG: hypothetical protein U1E83_08415 [Methylotetracoccus sp.]
MHGCTSHRTQAPGNSSSSCLTTKLGIDMPRSAYRIVGMFLLSVFSLVTQAHECRELGQVNLIGTKKQPVKPSYWICLGFAYENAALAQPGAGAPNNLDFYPYWVNRYVSGDSDVVSIDTRAGDKVDITATVTYLNGSVYDVPVDADFNLLDPFFFFKVPNVGFESTMGVFNTGVKKFEKTIRTFAEPIPIAQAGDHLTYRAPKDFVLPYRGMYQWNVKGTIQRRGQPSAVFDTKWTCQQPRVGYGPFDAADVDGTLAGAPEGWFDCVRYPANAGQQTNAATTIHGSPPADIVMNRLLARKSR